MLADDASQLVVACVGFDDEGLGKASRVDVASAILSFLKATRHVLDHRKGSLGLVRLVRGERT